MKLSGYARIDFRVNSLGLSYCYNVSTTPSLIDFSMLKFIFDEYKLPDEDIIHLIVGTL